MFSSACQSALPVETRDHQPSITEVISKIVRLSHVDALLLAVTE
jgi:hypothetical protein